MNILPKSPFMQAYAATMDRLITEKPIDRMDKIQALFEKVIGKVEINMDEQQVEQVRGCLHSLCELKPGRVLLKAWLRLSEEKQVPLVISKGNRTEYGDRSPDPKEIIYVSEEDLLCLSRYTTFKTGEPSYSYVDNYTLYQEGELALKPLYIALGHEILHMVHDLKEKHIHLVDWRNETNCLKGVTNPEEFHTILGVNLKLFSSAWQRGLPIEKEDVLSENALLLAARLPARISHGRLNRSEQIAMERKIEEGGFENYKSEYYDWLNKNLFELLDDWHNNGEELRSIIPECFLEDEDFLMKAAKNNSYVIAFIDQKKYKEVVLTAFRERSLFCDFDALMTLVDEDLKGDREFMAALK